MKKVTLTIITLTSLLIGSVSMASGHKGCDQNKSGEMKTSDYSYYMPQGFKAEAAPTPAATASQVGKVK